MHIIIKCIYNSECAIGALSSAKQVDTTINYNQRKIRKWEVAIQCATHKQRSRLYR